MKKTITRIIIKYDPSFYCCVKDLGLEAYRAVLGYNKSAPGRCLEESLSVARC